MVRGGASTYTQELRRGISILRTIIQFLNRELNDVQMNKTHKEQVIEQTEHYIHDLQDALQSVPHDFLERNSEYTELFQYAESLIIRLEQAPVVGGRRRRRYVRG